MAYRYRTTRANTNSKQTRSYGPSRRSSGGGHKKKVSTIDPRRFVKVATKQEQTPYVPTHTFADFAVAGTHSAKYHCPRLHHPITYPGPSNPYWARWQGHHRHRWHWYR